jgi:3-phenylpropionate/trans-cinnamate dioxygenase ferredoxin reductase subunit
MSPSDVIVVGGSTAGATALRELRNRGYEGRLTLVDPEPGTNRPPLSKAVLADAAAESSVLMDHGSLDIELVPAPASGLDHGARRLLTADGCAHPFDALVVATGSVARRIALPGQSGELVLRTVEDARRIRDRFATASTAVVVGAGFLGLEVATAAARAGLDVTVVDPDPPLERLLGAHLASSICERATALGITFRRSGAVLLGEPVHGVRLDDGEEVVADVVVSCVGDEPATHWLRNSGLEINQGIVIDDQARTSLKGVYAAGDVTALRSGDVVARAPFWANAVTQGRVAAASILGQPTDDPIIDHYFWTEIAGTTVKVVGPLPVEGEPRVLEDAGSGSGLLAWGSSTVVAYGIRRSLPRLRAILRDRAISAEITVD